MEAGHAHLLYYGVGLAEQHFTKASEAMGIKCSLVGALGKRTKFQQEDKAQLVLRVEYTNRTILEGEAPGPTLLSSDLPKDLQLNDDTRLNAWKFSDSDSDAVPMLRPVEQALLLALVVLMRRAQCHDIQLGDQSKVRRSLYYWRYLYRLQFIV